MRKFEIDARLILQLGRDSIKDHSTALIELVKNSFDADASKVEIDIFSKSPEKYIRVSDNGFGMTGKEIDQNWLRIGFSEKKKSKESKKGRRKTGEKGIGRIASDRLGAKLKMVTKSEEDEVQGVEINWDEFDVEGKALNEIELKSFTPLNIHIPKRDDEGQKATGTELIIKDLRTEWEEDDIKKLYQELSYFSPLFKEQFEICINNDVNPAYSKQVKSSIYSTAEIQLKLHYDGENTLIYEFKNKILPSLNKTETFELKQFLQQQKYSPLACGQIDLELLFFVRNKDLLEGTSFSMSDLKDFITENYGVKLYRDNVVVKPYGFSNNAFGQDWLGLDIERAQNPAGVGRSSYRVNANNIVGYAYFGRDTNPNLIDSASREGLLENEAFYSLKDLIKSSVRLLAAYRVDIIKQNKEVKKPSPKQSTSKYISLLKKKLNSVVEDINSVKTELDKNKVTSFPQLGQTINVIENVIDDTEKTFEELLDEKRVLSALATLGISSAVFGHETESAISTFKMNAKNAKGYLTKETPEIDVAVKQLEDALKQAKLISSWGVFALSRVEKEKRIKKNRHIDKLIKKTIEQVRPAFDALGIDVILSLKNVVAKTYAMDIESILLNLLTNAFAAVPNSTNPRKIKIFLEHDNKEEEKGLCLTVSDSGPGISQEYRDKVFEPLFTTKIGDSKNGSGTGLGLTIVKSIITELEGTIKLDKDKELKGAKFEIWLPRT